MKDTKVSIILNSLIVIIVVLGTIFMYTGYQFMTNTTLLDSSGLTAFRYYTVDSNIIVGIASLIMVIYEILLINKKIKSIPNFVYALKYLGVVGVSLTFLVTVLYLTPTYGNQAIYLYMNTNFLFHLVVPALSFISYVEYEKNELEFKYTFISLSSMFAYSIFYVINIFTHLENGKVVKGYDWYGFVVGGSLSIIIALLVIFTITYIISYLIYRLNRK